MNPLYATALFQAAPPHGGWPTTFAIITACDPRGQPTDDQLNIGLDAELEGRLQTLECWHWRVTGGSPDFSHAEPGFAIELPLIDAVELGRNFDQIAVFWIEGDELSVIYCDDGARQKIGSWRERHARGNALPRKGPCFGTDTDGNAPNS